MEDKKYWFRAKDYGWGWTPATREGWAVLIGYVVVLVWDFVRIDNASHSASDTLIAFAPDFAALTILLLLICYATGEWPHWRWGGKDLFSKKGNVKNREERGKKQEENVCNRFALEDADLSE